MAGLELALVTVVVPDYDEALAFFTGVLGFALREDRAVPEQGKRWVVVGPRGGGAGVLLARGAGEAQRARIGDQTGGRVAFFLHTQDVHAEVARLKALGVAFVREPAAADFGIAAVFRDPWGNLWDLVQPAA